MDVALVPQLSIEDLARGARITSMRRSRPDEIDAPRRLYTEDLVRHYLLGVSSDSPVIEYLSYYHVAEHFFQDVFETDLIERVRDQITMPDFSYRRKKDIRVLIKTIHKSLKLRAEEVAFS